MAVFEATPDGDARGAVIVVQEAFGVNAHIRDVTTRFASAGYHAVAPAYFHRAGGGAVEDYTDFSAIFPLFEGLSDDGIVIDTEATLDHLRAGGFPDDRIGIVGFCFGGRVTFLASLTLRARSRRRLLRRRDRHQGRAAVPVPPRRRRRPAHPLAGALRRRGRLDPGRRRRAAPDGAHRGDRRHRGGALPRGGPRLPLRRPGRLPRGPRPVTPGPAPWPGSTATWPEPSSEAASARIGLGERASAGHRVERPMVRIAPTVVVEPH